MRIFVTGAGGQLGHDVVNELAARGHEVTGSDLAPVYSGVQDGTAVCSAPYVQMDLTDHGQVSRVLTDAAPDAVIHCAAWTAVDDAEDEQKQPLVMAINGGGTRAVAEACAALGCRLLYISTDYVFDGSGETPWQPDCRERHALNYYGKSKLAGELAVEELVPDRHFIVRIAWVFGSNGNNFIRTMLRLSEKYDSLRVVCDQTGTPTYTLDLARLLADMIVTEKYGCYHVTNEGGYISWYDFACEIFRQAGRKVSVTPVTTEEYGVSKAARPTNSRLDRSAIAAAGFEPLPHWQDALARFLKEIGEVEP